MIIPFNARVPSEYLQTIVQQDIPNQTLPNGVTIKNLDQTQVLGTVPTTHSWQITIAPHVIITEPIIISDLVLYDKLTIIEKISIIVGSGSRVIFNESFANSRVHIKHIHYEIEPYAWVEVYSETDVLLNSFHYNNMRISIHDHAHFSYDGLIVGAGVVEVEMDMVMRGTYSEGRAHIASMQYGKGYCSIITHQYHEGSNTSSSVMVKQIVADGAHSNYQSLIDIVSTAQHVTAHQKHKALLLSDQAQALANPQLNVKHNKEVQCSHGSAISQLDNVQLWYMMTRGISWSNAQLLLLNGFFLDLFINTSFKTSVITKLKNVQRNMFRE